MKLEAGLPPRQRYCAMIAIALGIAMSVLDGAIANIALPTISRRLSAAPSDAVWIVNAYQLTITMTLLPLASLGERIGYRNVSLAGLALFTVSSLACAFSGSLPLLVMARTLQGLGAAGMMSVNSALVRATFSEKQLGRGISINTTVVALSSVIGPTVAAGILSVANWPWLFAINVPLGLIAMLIGFRALPHAAGARDQRYDLRSAILNALFFGIAVITVDGMGHGSAWPRVMIGLAATAGIGYLLVKRQSAQTAPLLPLDLLRIRVFALSIGTSVASFAAQTLAFLALPFLLQQTYGVSEIGTGLLMTPWPLVIVFVAPIAGILSDRYSAGLLGAIGLGTLTIGLALMASAGSHASSAEIAWRMALCGLGFGLFQSPNNRQILHAAPKQRSGAAGGMLATARVTGQTLGAALIAVIFTLSPQHGASAALYVGASLAALAAVVSAARLTESPVEERARQNVI